MVRFVPPKLPGKAAMLSPTKPTQMLTLYVYTKLKGDKSFFGPQFLRADIGHSRLQKCGTESFHHCLTLGNSIPLGLC